MKRIALLFLSFFILCTTCVTQAAENELPVYTSIRDVLDSSEGYMEIREYRDYIVLMLEMDGRYIRMVVLTDDYAKNLYQAFETENRSASAREAFEGYAWTLPLDYTEELPETPKSQAELDGLKGKTVQELMDEGFGREMILFEDELDSPVSINLECGFYRYEFEVMNAASGDPRLMIITSGRLNGFSRSAFDIDGLEKFSDPQ